MKALILCSCFLLNCLLANSQSGGVSISATGSLPDPSAALDISSTTKGTLVTRMTKAQRDSIANPAFGLLIFNTSTACFNMWTGAYWKQLCGDCDFSNPVPGNSGPICEGGTLYLTSTGVGNGATYQWTGPNGFTSNQQNPSITNATPGASGSYSVVATLNGCASAPQSTVATVNATPNTPAAGSNSPVCLGSNLSLTASTVAGASYFWTGPNSFTANTENPTLSNIQLADSGTYSVVASVTGCSSNAGITNVTVNTSISTPGNISGQTSVNDYSTGNTYSISPVSGAAYYIWTVPAGASITGGTDSTSITVSFAGIGSGTIKVAAANPANACGPGATSSIPVTINHTVLTFSYTSSIQTFTVPAGVDSITIQAYGAQGGTSNAIPGANGAYVNANFTVTPGSIVNIMVGQQGYAEAQNDQNWGGGGGGGSFVWDNSNTLWIAAGGGGGSSHIPGGVGSATTATTLGGTPGPGTATGGTGGNGGSGGGNLTTSYGGGGAGAGWFSNGAAGQNGSGCPGGGGGATPLNGGTGGYKCSCENPGPGGYGGGGGASVSGGGGGGYNGGGGGNGWDSTYSGGGGGGGSYIINTATNTGGTSGTHAGNGQVVITY